MSVTGQVGHIALLEQDGFGAANTVDRDDVTNYKGVKITGDSLVSNNNPLVAEGEIGTGRDVTQAIPGGFSSAGAINGNLRARAASVFLRGALGSGASAPEITAPPASRTTYRPADALPVWTLEKKIGTDTRSADELLTLRYTDTMVNTLNLTANSGGLSTFSAGLIACGEEYLDAAARAGLGTPLPTPVFDDKAPWDATTNPGGWNQASDDLLVFHGGRIGLKDSTNAEGVAFGYTGGTTGVGDLETTFQSLEVAINNNVAADEYTIRPSRFLRSLTEGIRAVELNLTIIFESYEKYQQYNYGATGRTLPGYNFYMGALEVALVNWQLGATESLATAAPAGVTNPQGVSLKIPKVAFTGLPVTLASGRIQVSTTARALKPASGDIIVAEVRPGPYINGA